MTLTADEFIRRFLLHVLPNGFRRIRYFGFLGNRHREEKLDCLPPPARYAAGRKRHPRITDGTRLPRPLRRAYRAFAPPMPAMPERHHDRGPDPSEVVRQISGGHRFIMIPSIGSELATKQVCSASTAGEVCGFRDFSRPPSPIRPIDFLLAGRPHLKRPPAGPFQTRPQRANSLPETDPIIQSP